MPPSPPSPPSTPSAALLRTLNAFLYALFAALGAGLLGRPALLALAGFGLTAPSWPWRVPFGGLFALLLVLLVASTLRLAWAVVRAARVGLAERGIFLALVGLSFALRTVAAEPTPPADPTAQLSEALRLTARALDESWPRVRSYQPDVSSLNAQLEALGPSAYAVRGRPLPVQVQLIAGTAIPQVVPDVAALPGSIVLALSPDHTRALLWALVLERGRAVPLKQSNGRTLVLAVRGGTHGALGKDPLLPDYPGARTVDTQP